jgi:hypothetical protein
MGRWVEVKGGAVSGMPRWPTPSSWAAVLALAGGGLLPQKKAAPEGAPP